MAYKPKPDLSRLVMLGNVSPSEAVILYGALMTVRQRAEGLPLTTCEVLDGFCSRIDLQLKALAWPPQSKAPYPV